MQFVSYPLVSHLQVEVLLFEIILGQSLCAHVNNQIANFGSFVICIVLSDKYEASLFVIEKHVDDVSALVEIVVD